MDNPGYIMLSRLSAQMRATAVIAHNLANADTPGFKAERPVFNPFESANRGAQAGSGDSSTAYTWDRATWRDLQNGSLQTTGNPLDLALTGDGFFAVETPRGERYSRAGRFGIASDGRIVDSNGHALLNENGQPIVVASGDSTITVTGDGTLRSENGPIGRIKVMRFASPQQLMAEGERLYAAPNGDGEVVARPGIIQGALEASNVNSITEMTRMMTELREFQFASQFAEREGERQQSVIDRLLRHK